MDEKILKQLERLNKTMDNLLLLILCKEGCSYEQIRTVIGKADNNRVAKIRAGLAGKNK